MSRERTSILYNHKHDAFSKSLIDLCKGMSTITEIENTIIPVLNIVLPHQYATVFVGDANDSSIIDIINCGFPDTLLLDYTETGNINIFPSFKKWRLSLQNQYIEINNKNSIISTLLYV